MFAALKCVEDTCFLCQESVMVIGVDAFHDVARGRRSIGGFVASTNPELTRWISRVRIQMQGEELLPGLRFFMVTAIRKYYEVSEVFCAWFKCLWGQWSFLCLVQMFLVLTVKSVGFSLQQVLVTFNALLGATWLIVYFLQGRLGIAANFTRAYWFVCPAVVTSLVWTAGKSSPTD